VFPHNFYGNINTFLSLLSRISEKASAILGDGFSQIVYSSNTIKKGHMSNAAVLLRIDRVLEFLATDRAWHTIDEIARKTGLPAEESAEIVDFFAINQFISLNEQGKRAKIEESVDRFLKQILEEEKLSAL